jgi:molybdate transport system ATP-binding protein
MLSIDCRYRYRDGFALDVAFEVGAGVTALCGPSGSGKTSVLSLVAGLRRPAEGRIVIGDAVVVDTSKGVWVPPERRMVGMVFQDSLLFPHRTVGWNLRFGLRRRPDARFGFDRVVKVLELGELLDRRPATLSGGQSRRVALGRALLSGPRLLLLDEPWTGLDEPLVERITTFLERCLESWSLPTLLVSHDRGKVERLSSATVRLRGGRVASVHAGAGAVGGSGAGAGWVAGDLA